MDKTLSESIIEYFGIGAEVDIYFSESAGSTFYAENDIEDKIFVSGRIMGAIGKGLIVETVVSTPVNNFVKTVMLNDWAITGVMKKENDGIRITKVFQEARK